jgi:uncharacterized membrane protein
MGQGLVFLVAYLLGFLGVHRFITGHKKSGFLYLFTLGLMGLGYLADLFMIYFGAFKDGQGNPLVPMGKVGRVLATIALVIIVISLIASLTSTGS